MHADLEECDQTGQMHRLMESLLDTQIILLVLLCSSYHEESLKTFYLEFES